MVPAPFHQIQKHASIKGATARSHHQAVQRRKTHGGRHAAPRDRAAQAGAIAKMRHHHAALRPVRQVLQLFHHILVGQAMESVSTDALSCQRLR